MKTINIKGKEYAPVNERLKEFRANHEDYSLITEIIELDGDVCVMQAKIIDSNGRVIAIGTAREERDDKSSMVNRTSYVENCETSAWGRALGNFGIGIDESIATAEEVRRAIAKQELTQPPAKPAQAKSTQQVEMTLEEARNKLTKSGKRFCQLTTEQLDYIIANGGAESATAARLVLEDLTTGDMAPIVEEGLPF